MKHQVSHSPFVKNKNLTGIYDVTYDDYSYEDVIEYLEGNIPNNINNNACGCSGVRYKDYLGRSFDYYYIDVPNFLITTSNKNGRFASIGLSGGDFSLNIDRINRINNNERTKKDILDEKLLPFAMLDGINENGVVITGNVVPSCDLVPHENEKMYITHGTNPGKDNLHIQFVIRYVLDFAKSAKHAIELLQNVNITGVNSKGEIRDYCGLYKIGYELHFMIADKNDNFVVEIINDKLNVISANIMTNFYLSILTPSSAGIERFQILQENYQNVMSLENMKTLIEKVRYSNVYNSSLGYMQFPSELSSKELPYHTTKQYFEENWDSIKPLLDSSYALIQSGTKAQAPKDGVPWISSHAEVFDLKNKTISICSHENYSIWCTYSFSKLK